MDWASHKHPLPTENMKSNMKVMNSRRQPLPTETNRDQYVSDEQTSTDDEDPLEGNDKGEKQ